MDLALPGAPWEPLGSPLGAPLAEPGQTRKTLTKAPSHLVFQPAITYKTFTANFVSSDFLTHRETL